MSPATDDAAGVVEAVFREEYGRIVAALVGRFRDLELAEDVAQEAFAEAVRRWPASGVPANPAGWLALTARNRAVDRLRRESTRDARQQEAQMMLHPSTDPSGPDDPDDAATSVPDQRLQLLFTCCHPALAPQTRVALTLRMLGGLEMAEVAAAFLVPERTMAQRLTRAKRKILQANIPYRVPRDAELPDRLAAVLAVVYLVFNAGYQPRTGDVPLRTDLSAEAIRLGRVLRGLMPDEPEVAGLLALMLLIDARREARNAGGTLVPLDEQDRSRWDAGLVAEGHDLVRWCLHRHRTAPAGAPGPGHYQLMAAVNAVHADAATYEGTDWRQVLALYDQLYVVTPTPVVALNRAIALAEVEGPERALALVDGLGGQELDRYQPFHATRADLLRRLGRAGEARAAYDRALGLTGNPGERDLLTRRRDALPD